jgi:hypothetical protein
MVHRSKIESSPVSAPSAQPQRQRGVTARSVGSFVPRLTQKAMQKYGFSTAALLTDWPTIVGREMAAYTSPLKLVWPRAPEVYGETPAAQSGRPGATLFLKVEAARALDIEYKRAQIVERINGYFGYRAVAELRIQQAPIAPLAPSKPRDVVAPKTRAARPGVDLGGIRDEGLRAALERLQLGIARR